MAITSGTRLGGAPINFLRPCLLLLLEESPGHGYELRDRLAELGASSPPDTAIVYRALNAMENEGLISSRWQRSTEGPQRRCYALTTQGREALGGWALQLAELDLLVGGVLRRLDARAC
ncbi:PadR family transcriptional regulator [Pseudonocardia sp.]|jgi:poly-beta-hydroxybutyrate-responsive repressor|uniref:PadR family transcriptional regulator n=1 Tax=Pseudonocardia sp. TaxID=60912 RepID=UPI0026241C90|nr:PadR family transcriptional regulator [Pseudonocardia sp.]MCW2717456.1 PadR family transcriptional regulator [Pseudonocardia sp.]MDB5067057.1 PadR family transcriptional regulator [Chloroflexota bacterium]